MATSSLVERLRFEGSCRLGGGCVCGGDLPRVRAGCPNYQDLNLAQEAADHIERLEAELAIERERVGRIMDYISEQITHAVTRIRDGDELGSRVWRIALEDIVREGQAFYLKEHTDEAG